MANLFEFDEYVVDFISAFWAAFNNIRQLSITCRLLVVGVVPAFSISATVFSMFRQAGAGDAQSTADHTEGDEMDNIGHLDVL